MHQGAKKALQLSVCDCSGVSSRTRSHDKTSLDRNKNISSNHFVPSTDAHPETDALKLSCTHVESIDLVFLANAAVKNKIKGDCTFFSMKHDTQVEECGACGHRAQLEVSGFKHGCFPGLKPLHVPVGMIRNDLDIPTCCSTEAAKLALMSGVSLEVEESPFVHKSHHLAMEELPFEALAAAACKC